MLLNVIALRDDPNFAIFHEKTLQLLHSLVSIGGAEHHLALNTKCTNNRVRWGAGGLQPSWAEAYFTRVKVRPIEFI